MDPHLFHYNQLYLLSYINDIQVVNLISQSGATFHREFIIRTGSPMRLLRQSFQLLGKRPNLLILRIVQEIISRNQEGIEKKKRLDPIPVTYTELLPKLLARQLVALSCVLPLKPPFPKSYNPNVHCDYHFRNLGHSTEDCLSFKQQVQTLIETGKINFKSSHQPSNLSLNFSGARTEEVEEFVTIIGGVQGRKTGCTSEKIEEEKKSLGTSERE